MIRKITFKKDINVFSKDLNNKQREDFDYYCSIFRMPDPFIIKKGDFLTPTPDSKFSDMMITSKGVEDKRMSTILPDYVLDYLRGL